MPLTSKWWLGKKPGKEAYIVPSVVDGHVEFSMSHDLTRAPSRDSDGTVGRGGATCISCGTSVPLAYVREQGKSAGLGHVLMATVAEGSRRRIYLAPDDVARDAADVAAPAEVPVGDIPINPKHFNTPNYGLSTFSSLFTNRQLVTLTTLSDLVLEVRDRVFRDTMDSNMSEGTRLEVGGASAAAYADAVATYLAFTVDRIVDRNSSVTTWDSSPSKEQVRGIFARQAIPMAWDYSEANPFASSSGTILESVNQVARAIDRIDAVQPGVASQADAASRDYGGRVLSTDPPYYDNIGYADLSDFFYVWLRRSLQTVFPELLSTMLVPKAEELVANPYRHAGADVAKAFFETGFEHVFEHARQSANPDFPITVYYAFKQSETDDEGRVSTGWETILGSMVKAGWTVTATWPMRSELGNRLLASGTNALASSVLLALRPRPADAPTTDRRGFIASLKRELSPALRDLQTGGISPVDLPQAAIGPGMAVFSRYSSVVESNGSPMQVRAALAHINEMLDEVLTEQEGDFDSITRFALAWYRGHGYESAAYGDAEDLARARGTAVSMMERSGILTARAGRVQLFRPSDLDSDYDVLSD